MNVPIIGLVSADTHTARRQALLGNALGPFVDEMRLVEFEDLADYVACGQFANLDDIVQSSLELSYASRSFTFGWGAQVELAWRASPVLALDMEFSGGGMTAFFVLRIGADTHDVEIRCITSNATGDSPSANSERLAAALRAARQGSDKSATAR